MIDLLVQRARLVSDPAAPPVSLRVDAGRLVAIDADPRGDPAAARLVLDARLALVSPPYVEPHVHLDTTLTAGEPRWNASGTLWEGIACWAERRRTVTREDTIRRAEEVLRWQVAHGVLHVRSHVDVTDPALIGLDALLEVRDRVRDVVDLQLVAFPQEGICSSPGGEERLEEAARRGVDAIGAIPHFEDTREDGVRSVEVAVDLAERRGLLVDAHCDEIDDEQSRFVEVLATRALRAGLGGRVTASHTTAMGSYNGAYSFKLQRILRRSGIHLVCNPMVNLHLQGRLDAYPRRRGLTQVKELLAAGVNVAFGHDDIMDPWFPLGTADPTLVAHVGALAAQLMGPDEISECFRMVTDRAAAVLSLDDRYGLVPGRPASFVVLPAVDPFDVIRRQVRPSHVVAHGRIVAETPAAATRLAWPGREPELVDFVRSGDADGAPWRPPVSDLPTTAPGPPPASIVARDR
ncbi:MAG TPA: cytosine deaminase [Acidimicrobiales bacterium]|nr:cytosine deaminase [Acidimicrobiales bacterium]